MPKRVRTPNCTHVDMDRIYGRDQQCFVCGRSPSIGFLYECRQDTDRESLHDQILREQDDRIEPAKSDLRLELESVGLSESIILTAENGHYTDTQLEKLKELKLELRQTILDTRQASQINDAVAKLAAIARAPFDGTCNSMPNKDLTFQVCAFKACHTCRPYYRDRVYISVEAILCAEFPPMTREDIENLPTKSSRIMRSTGTTALMSPSPVDITSPITLPTQTSLGTSFGAPQTASTTSTRSSELTFKTTQTDTDEISAQRRPRRRFYRMGRRSSGDIARDLSSLPSLLTRQGLKTAVQGIFRPGRQSSSSGSNITLPLPRTGTLRDLTDTGSVREFDVGTLRRVRRQKEKNDLRNGTYAGGFEDVNIEHHRRAELSSSHLREGDVDAAGEPSTSESSDFSVYSSASEGSEVEVEGGVALTEEAVEMHTPDILAVDVPARKQKQKFGPVVAAEEVFGEDRDGDGDEEGAEDGLQGIMTQV